MHLPPPRPTVGGCMIVRNGALTVRRALLSLAPVVSHLVVVDTGSDDGTPALCSRLGAEVHFRAWNNSFADARNYAIGLMRTDWIIALDADETLDVASFEAARPLLDNPQTGALRVAIHNRLATGATVESVHHYPRIFRRHPAIRYTGTIHEQIGEAVERAGFAVADAPVVITHDGYATVSQDKIDRNTTLLRAELDARPGDPWLSYHLGLTEFAAQHYDDAHHLLHDALESAALSPQQADTARLRLAQIALGREDWKELEKRISFTGSDEHTEGFRLFIDAVRHVVCGNPARARTLLAADAVEHSRLVDRTQLAQLREICAVGSADSSSVRGTRIVL